MTTILDTPLILSDSAQDLLFREARTANSFTDQPVTAAQVEAIHELVKYGPTALNGQPLRVVLVRSPEARARLATHLGGSNKDKTAAAPLVAVLAYDVDFHEHLPRVFPHVPGLKDNFSDEAVRHGLARSSALLQAGYFIVGVRAAGLAAGPMGGFDADGLDADFFPDGRIKSVLVVNIGHPGPDAWLDRLPRLTYDEVVTTV